MTDHLQHILSEVCRHAESALGEARAAAARARAAEESSMHALTLIRRLITAAGATESVAEIADPTTNTAERSDLQMVRHRRRYGGCVIVGTLVRETATGYTYLDADGRTRRSVFRRRPRHAGERPPEPHIAPCSDCPEERDPRACMHGRVGWCETCASS